METAGLWEELPPWTRKAILAWECAQAREQPLFPEAFVVAGEQAGGDWQISYRDAGCLKLLMLHPRRGSGTTEHPYGPDGRADSEEADATPAAVEMERPIVTILPLLTAGELPS